MGNRISQHLACVFILFVGLCATCSTFAQHKNKPTLKNFAERLKRIKWNPETKAAIEISSSSKAPSDDDVIQVETSLVATDLLVVDARGQFVIGLTEKDFLIAEDGQPQRIGMFSLGDSANLSRSIVLIIDYSGSQFPFIRTSVDAAKSLVDKLVATDQMAIVTDDVEVLQDFTDDKQKLKQKLDSLLSRVNSTAAVTGIHVRFGRSKQFSALMATLKSLDNESERQIIIFQTDGDELAYLRESTLSPIPPADATALINPRALAYIMKRVESDRTEFSLNDICRAGEKSQATIYTVIPGFQMLGLSKNDQVEQVRRMFEQEVAASAGKGGTKRFQEYEKQMTPEIWEMQAEQVMKMQVALATVSTATGGWTMFLERPSEADEIYSRILADINRRYIVGYYPTNKEHDGKRRKISITVRDHPEYLVIGRKAYYSPLSDQ